MQRRWIIITAIALLVLVSGAGIWWWSKVQSQAKATQQAELTALQELEQSRNQFVADTSRQLWFTASADKVTRVIAGNTLTATSLGMGIELPTYYSEVVPSTKHWYGIGGNTLTKYAGPISTIVGAVQQRPVKPELAVAHTESALAWVAQQGNVQQIQVYNLADDTEVTWFTGEPYVEYGNLTWSPDGTELAFTANRNTIVMINKDGAELTKRIYIPSVEWSSLTWITPEEFGAVATSDSLNPEPFEPYVAVVTRTGDITERHMVFDKIGVPKVVWHSTGTAFAFVDPWQNVFRIYNRYDQLVQSVAFATNGKLTPMGLTDGVGASLTEGITVTDVNTNSDSNVNNNTGEEIPEFTVSAEDWESFNTTIRGMLTQWPIDFSSYRFSVNDKGIQVSFQPPEITKDPLELIAVQVVEQIFAMLPSVPSVSVTINDATNQPVLALLDVQREQAAKLAEEFTTRTTEQLFVVNKENPYGKRSVKPENHDHHYVGDLVYSTLGDYNPNPALGRLGAEVGPTTFYLAKDNSYVLLYPTDLNIKQLDDRTTLFYNSDTTFVSATAFGTYGITLKRFDAPGITLEQWLSVNRSDSVTEALGFNLPKPLTGVKLVSKTPHTAEAVVVGNNNAYVFTITRDAGITDADKITLDELVKSFSLTYVFQRN